MAVCMRTRQSQSLAGALSAQEDPRYTGIVTPLTLTSSISSGGPQVVTPLTLTVAISSGGPQVVTPPTLTVAISSGGPQV